MRYVGAITDTPGAVCGGIADVVPTPQDVNARCDRGRRAAAAASSGAGAHPRHEYAEASARYRRCVREPRRLRAPERPQTNSVAGHHAGPREPPGEWPCRLDAHHTRRAPANSRGGMNDAARKFFMEF